MKNKITLLIFIILLSIPIIVSALEQQPSSFTCDVFTKARGGMSMKMNIFVKGNKFRMEGVMSGVESVTIYDGNSAYVYIPQQNVAMSVPLNQASRDMIPTKWNIDSQCSYLGNEELNGVLTKRYNCDKVRAWIAEDNGFPVKIISDEVEMYYSNFKKDVVLEDSLFMLPSGVNLMDIGNAVQGLGSNQR